MAKETFDKEKYEAEHKALNEAIKKAIKESNLHSLTILKPRKSDELDEFGQTFGHVFGEAIFGAILDNTAAEAVLLLSKLPKDIKSIIVEMNHARVEVKRDYAAEDVMKVYDIQSALLDEYYEQSSEAIAKYEKARGIGKQKSNDKDDITK